MRCATFRRPSGVLGGYASRRAPWVKKAIWIRERIALATVGAVTHRSAHYIKQSIKNQIAS
jgi:hypothetical protein